MTQLAPAVENRLYTLDEFEALDLPDDGKKYELVEGMVVKSSLPGDEEGRCINDLSFILNSWLRPRGMGQIWVLTSFRLAPGFPPAPDVAFLTTEHLPKTSKGAVEAVPDLVVEVWSPRDLDTRNHREEAQRKIRRYQTAGVRIVWSINPSARTVAIYHPNQLTAIEELDDNGVLSGEDLLPGFTFPVKSLFSF